MLANDFNIISTFLALFACFVICLLKRNRGPIFNINAHSALSQLWSLLFRLSDCHALLCNALSHYSYQDASLHIFVIRKWEH